MTRISRRLLGATWALTVLAWLAGCSALSPYSHMTKLNLTLNATDQLELRPGQTLSLKLSIDPESRFVGILAAYRDLDQAQWRRVQAIRIGERVTANLYLDQAGIHNGVPPVAQAGERP